MIVKWWYSLLAFVNLKILKRTHTPARVRWMEAGEANIFIDCKFVDPADKDEADRFVVRPPKGKDGGE